MAEVRKIPIDFKTCEPGVHTFYIPIGSKSYELEKAKDGFCILKYGGYIEDPKLSKDTATVCRVPTFEGVREFEVKTLGPDYSPIQSYCRSGSKEVDVLNLYPFFVGSLVIVALVAGYYLYKFLLLRLNIRRTKKA